MATLREIFTIPEELVKKLNEHSKQSMIPKSRLVAHLLREFFDKKETINHIKN